jgi:hypothetical protein
MAELSREDLHELYGRFVLNPVLRPFSIREGD